MSDPGKYPFVHRFCWADLATVDDARARAFYGRLFNWSGRRREAGRGQFSTLEHEGDVLASLYRLSSEQLGGGVPSHWLAYVSTPNLESTMARAVVLGAEILVTPHDFAGLARVAVMVDPTGALVGLWQSGRPGGWNTSPPPGDE